MKLEQITDPLRSSWFEASARTRIAGLLDENSFSELIGPQERVMSPHLKLFNLTAEFDDGLIIGRGKLDGTDVYIAAQEGRFMGGSFGEVHGAKLVGLLRTACDQAGKGGPKVVLLALDTGGVRLQEANLGELAISELINAILEARIAGVNVIALIGGSSGAFGGGGITTASCSRIAVSEQGRISVSGPEVIENNKGVEEFDSKDRGLVWRVTGGRTRTLLGGADEYVDDESASFRQGAIALLKQDSPFNLETMQAEQKRLEDRLQKFGACKDAPDIWRGMDIQEADQIADMPFDQFKAIATKRSQHDAR